MDAADGERHPIPHDGLPEQDEEVRTERRTRVAVPADAPMLLHAWSSRQIA
jgi:hypothetical protein